MEAKSNTITEVELPIERGITTAQQLLDSEFNPNRTIFNTDFPNLNLPATRIAFIGKSGTGKSSLINMLTNIFEDRQYQGSRAISITQTIPKPGKDKSKITLHYNIAEFKDRQSDIEGGKQCDLQTQRPNIYHFPTANCQVSLIDTPGIGDTRGFENDKLIVRSVVEALKASEKFNALCLIFKSSDQRVDPIIKYMVHQYQSIMTAECRNNLVVCFTYTTDIYRIDAHSALLEAGIITEETPCFCFDNSCLLPASNYDFITNSRERQSRIKYEKEKWIRNCENAQNLLLQTSQLKTIDSDSIVQLYLQRNLAFKITNEQIKKVEKIGIDEKEIKSQLNGLIDLLKQINEAQNVTDPVKVPIVAIKKRTVKKAVKKCVPTFSMCIYHGTCHPMCDVEDTDQIQGHYSLLKCKIFKKYLFFDSNICNRCKCDYSKHMFSDHIMHEKEEEENYEVVEYMEGVMTNEKKKQAYDILLLKQKYKEAELKCKEKNSKCCWKIKMRATVSFLALSRRLNLFRWRVAETAFLIIWSSTLS